MTFKEVYLYAGYFGSKGAKKVPHFLKCLRKG